MRKKMMVRMGRKKTLTSIVCIALVVMLAGVLMMPAQGTAKAKAGEGKTLKIGAIIALSGWFSPFGLVAKDIAEITRDIINERGGIVVKGEHYMVELLIEDYGSTFPGVTAATNKLVYDKGVKYLMTPSAFFTPPTTAIAEPNKVLRVQTFNVFSPDELSKDTPYAFLCNDGSLEHNIALVKYLKDNHPEIKSVTVVLPENNLAKLWPEVKKMLENAGIEVIGKPISFLDEIVDWTPIAAKAIAAKSDAVYNSSALALHMGALLKSMREQGSDKFLAVVIGTSPTSVMAVSGKEAAYNFAAVGLVPFPPDAPPLMTEIMKRFYANHGLDSGFTLQPANCLWMLKQAIEKAQSLDTTVVRDTWEKMETFDSPFGTSYLGGLKTYGIKHAVPHPNAISVLENGEAKFGAWVEVRVP